MPHPRLRRENDNLIDIRTKRTIPIIQPTNRDSILATLLKRQQQWRAQNDPLVRIPRKERVDIIRIIVYYNRTNATQNPLATETVGLAKGLVAETEVVGVLVVEGDPLLRAVAFDAVESYRAVIAADIRGDEVAVCEIGFLQAGVTGDGDVLVGVVVCALDRGVFSRFYVQVVDVVPVHIEGLGCVVDAHREPNIAGFPERVAVPLVAHVEVGGVLCAIDAHAHAGLGVKCACVEGGDNEGLRPGTFEVVGAEGYNVCEKCKLEW